MTVAAILSRLMEPLWNGYGTVLELIQRRNPESLGYVLSAAEAVTGEGDNYLKSCVSSLLQ